ncbi:MAG: lysine 2,3-aminomutase [Spirochaetes bacterium GWF1_41_5]|nr:MAG: lysine 2,3-aminomutase [Spirochaetes bacterium GWF1_41_5]HBE01277.1 lysine 2,3-aminomutase [Spirochaetia bacterium]
MENTSGFGPASDSEPPNGRNHQEPAPGSILEIYPSFQPAPAGAAAATCLTADENPLQLIFPIESDTGQEINRKTIQPSFKTGQRSLSFKEKFFSDASINEWNNWKWQIANSITSLSELRRYLRLSKEEKKSLAGKNKKLPLRITPYYLSLIDSENPMQALRRTVVPVADELKIDASESADPLSEDHDTPVAGLVHRYPDRVLFLATGFCSSFCRYCTRSRLVGENCLDENRWEPAIEYIRKNTNIRDVLISGGDPLTLADEQLDYLLGRLSSIPHIDILRIGTKIPAVLPQRITPQLVKILSRRRALWMNIHFTHPDEVTPETSQACTRLASAGIPLGSQTVLLKGINDHPAVMKSLYHALLRVRVRPYYLYQCDPIRGSGHFRTSVKTGLDIIENLRGHTSGLAVPQYVIDAPGGGGKIPLLPEYFQKKEDQNIVLRNYEGKIFRYPDIYA